MVVLLLGLWLLLGCDNIPVNLTFDFHLLLELFSTFGGPNGLFLGSPG